MLTLPLLLSLQALAAEAAPLGAPRTAPPADTVFRSALLAATGLDRAAAPDTTRQPATRWPAPVSRDRLVALAERGRTYVPTPNPCPNYPMPMFWPADPERYAMLVVKLSPHERMRMPAVSPCAEPAATDSASGR